MFQDYEEVMEQAARINSLRQAQEFAEECLGYKLTQFMLVDLAERLHEYKKIRDLTAMIENHRQYIDIEERWVTNGIPGR